VLCRGYGFAIEAGFLQNLQDFNEMKGAVPGMLTLQRNKQFAPEM
jgi:hypothetical protein